MVPNDSSQICSFRGSDRELALSVDCHLCTQRSITGAILVLSLDSGSRNASEVPGGSRGRLLINGLFRRAPLLLCHVLLFQCFILLLAEEISISAFILIQDSTCLNRRVTYSVLSEIYAVGVGVKTIGVLWHSSSRLRLV